MSKKRRKKKASASSDVSSRAYEAALSTPLRRHVVGADLSHDAANERAMGRIRDWGRYLDENSDVAVAILDDFVKGVVGAGIVTIPKPLNLDGSINEALGSELIKWWRRWARRCEVTGQLPWSVAQQQICRGWPRDGEYFVQHVVGFDRGYPFAPGEVPYRVELMESDLIPFDFNDTRRGWRQGVQRNQWNAPTNYAKYKFHPGDTGMAAMPGVPTMDELVIVPATQMLHIMHSKRWPATRGVSLFHPVVSRIYDAKDLEESERVKNRNLSNWVAAIIKSPDLIGTDAGKDERGRRYHEQFQGMMIDTLAPGESIEGVGPDYPVSNMPDHINDQIRRACAGTGTRHSSVARRYDGNYAAQRQEMVESEGHYQMREDCFTQMIVRPVYEMWATTAIMSGVVDAPAGVDLDLLLNAEYRGPVTPWIDPLKEVQGDALAVEKGFASIDQIRIKRGAPAEMIGEPAPQPAAAPRPPQQLSLVPDEEDDAA